MDLSFLVNLTSRKISVAESDKTTHKEAISNYITYIESENGLEGGTLKDALVDAIPICLQEAQECPIFSHAALIKLADESRDVIADSSVTCKPNTDNMVLSDSFGAEGGIYIVSVKPECLKYFLAGSEY